MEILILDFESHSIMHVEFQSEIYSFPSSFRPKGFSLAATYVVAGERILSISCFILVETIGNTIMQHSGKSEMMRHPIWHLPTLFQFSLHIARDQLVIYQHVP